MFEICFFVKNVYLHQKILWFNFKKVRSFFSSTPLERALNSVQATLFTGFLKSF